jgi:hypothetical protein
MGLLGGLPIPAVPPPPLPAVWPTVYRTGRAPASSRLLLHSPQQKTVAFVIIYGLSLGGCISRGLNLNSLECEVKTRRKENTKREGDEQGDWVLCLFWPYFATLPCLCCGHPPKRWGTGGGCTVFFRELAPS